MPLQFNQCNLLKQLSVEVIIHKNARLICSKLLIFDDSLL